MTRTLLATLLLPVALLTAAVDAAQQPQPGAITGRVVDGFGPLPGATVAVTGENVSRTAVTDRHGDYRFDDLPHGEYRVQVEFISKFVPKVAALAVETGRTTLHNVELRLAPGAASSRDYRERSQQGAIAGTVRDTGGGVLPGVTVRVLGPAASRGVTTNSRGEFRFSGLPSGAYRIEATLTGFRREVDDSVRVDAGQLASRDVFLRLVPGELLPSGLRAEMPVDETVAALRDLLSVGESKAKPAPPVVPATEPPPPTAAIPAQTTPDVKRSLGVLVGRVVDASGAGLPGVTVTVTAGKTGRKVTTDKGGDYRVEDLPPGTYVVSATLPGFRPAEATVRVTLEQVTTSHIVLQREYRGHGGDGGHGEDRRLGRWG